MSAADYADLARHAEAATPGPWNSYGNGHHEVHQDPDVGDGDYITFHVERQADAEFIAAANPATILRLIEQVREWHRVAASSEAARNEARIERDRLAARLAAVEALADETERAGDPLLRLDRLRAVLSAAPTDTTKEN